ncbi:HAMP domain-containing sensor histidine kinase [Micromonospora sp. NPDC049559]|uniref:sensor histidine kinase n=1 Tax=Micromonospora sp. NPDC049559 TaxID=3155923 RepID=UPI00343A9BD5
MRRRLIVSYLLLLTLVLLALELPLADTLANREMERVRADRLADATRFASLSGPALRLGVTSAVRAELNRYEELYSIGAAVVDRDRAVVVASPGYATRPEATGAALRAAFAGQQFTSFALTDLWSGEPLVVAAPVSDGGEVLGTVIITSPTNRLRRAVLGWWATLAAIGALAVLAFVLTAVRLANWVLRPVTVLDAATHEIAAGDRTARVRHSAGPPELRRLAASFNHMADAVSDLVERQRAFVAHASHQLRNPLTALRLRVEELGPSLTDEYGRTEHALALDETDRLAHVLDGLLALARAERSEETLVVVDAAEVAGFRERAWEPLARHRRITLTVRRPSEPVYALTVPTALDQALDALIDNALKFADEGGRVEVVVDRADDGVRVVVRDDGPGLPDGQLQQATERFWRAPQTQNVEGAGLGLAIVAVLVDVSGGRLTMRPAQPRGLAATLWFRAA